MTSLAPAFFSSSTIIIGVTLALLAAVYVLFFRPKLPRAALDPVTFRLFILKEKHPISPNTSLYRFALQLGQVLGLPIGQHISVMKVMDGRQVVRSYTPTSSDATSGHFDLVIKTYPTGIISKMFSELHIGDTIQVRGPKGNFKYTPNMVKKLGMIAGGTGITPMLQITRAIMNNPEDHTDVSLIFANVNEEDILLREELDELAVQHSNFRVYYVLNNPPEGWSGGVGFVTANMIREHCPSPSPYMKIITCGPPPMVKVIAEYCDELGYEKSRLISKLQDQVFKF